MIVEAALVGLSLCADCLAVSLCSSVTVPPEALRRQTGRTAFLFALIQTGFLLAGWGIGAGAAGLLGSHPWFWNVARVLGFLLLLYVGGSLFLSGIRGKADRLDLSATRSILLGGVATSIDALAVGVSMALGASSAAEIGLLAASVFLFTALSVVLGMLAGSLIGRKFGQSAQIVGGLVLIGLGVRILIAFSGV